VLEFQICKYEAMNVELLLETLIGASSQNPNTIKESEQRLRSLEAQFKIISRFFGILDQYFYLWPKFLRLTKISIFGPTSNNFFWN